MTVSRAGSALEEAILKIAEKYELTNIELAAIQVGRLESTLKYALRAERHPDDPTRKADEA
jgi:hypothetical protein